jgi:hypothetical protein
MWPYLQLLCSPFTGHLLAWLPPAFTLLWQHFPVESRTLTAELILFIAPVYLPLPLLRFKQFLHRCVKQLTNCALLQRSSCLNATLQLNSCPALPFHLVVKGIRYKVIWVIGSALLKMS